MTPQQLSVATDREVQDLGLCGHPPETIAVITEVVGTCPCGRYLRRCDTRGRDARGQLGHLQCMDPVGWEKLVEHVQRQHEGRQP